jgi:hypothetical protein
VKVNLSECIDDIIAENTILRSKLRDLGMYIVDCGVKAETVINVLVKCN